MAIGFGIIVIGFILMIGGKSDEMCIRDRHERSEWFGCACCPSNIARFIPSMPNYIYARKENDFYVNLFVPGSATFETSKGSFKLIQDSNMPWNGHIYINPETDKPLKANLLIRIPGWASENPVPCDIYEFMNSPSAAPVFKINEKVVTPEIKNGYAVLSKKWETGDKIDINFPYEIRKIKAHPEIEDNKGKMALQLGPLVYCTEWADYEETGIPNIYLDPKENLSFGFRPGKLGGLNTITGEASILKKGEGPDKGEFLSLIHIFAIKKSEETGRIDNFAVAGGLKEGSFCSAFPFDDSDVFKIIEGAAYSLQFFDDEKLEKTIDSLIYLIGEAQEDDGYIFTNRTILGDSGHVWIGTKRWEKPDEDVYKRQGKNPAGAGT